MGFNYDTWGGSWGSSWGNSWGQLQAQPEPEPAQAPAAPDRGFDEYMEAFRLERLREQRLRENSEIERIIDFDREVIRQAIMRALGKDTT